MQYYSTIYYCKKLRKWTCVVQTHAVQGSTLYKTIIWNVISKSLEHFSYFINDVPSGQGSLLSLLPNRDPSVRYLHEIFLKVWWAEKGKTQRITIHSSEERAQQHLRNADGKFNTKARLQGHPAALAPSVLLQIKL